MSQPDSPPTLLVRSPQGGTRVCALSRTPFTIGRAPENDLCLEDRAVSARHARIVNVQNLWFIEDLGSRSGTFVNEQTIDRRRLCDADSIRLGTYRLMFQDQQEGVAGSSHAQEPRLEDTPAVVSHRREAKTLSPDRHIGIVEILSGQTGQAQYRLTRQISLVGAQDDAFITLTGWFAPKTAAMISRHSEGYVVSQTESRKPILINGRLAQGEQPLCHGDVVEVAGITMRFLLRDHTSSAA